VTACLPVNRMIKREVKKTKARKKQHLGRVSLSINEPPEKRFSEGLSGKNAGKKQRKGEP